MQATGRGESLLLNTPFECEHHRADCVQFHHRPCRLCLPVRDQLEDQKHAIAQQHEHTLKPAECQLCFHVSGQVTIHP